MDKLKEGFYYLKSPNEPAPTLVHGYHCTDLGGAFVFGFNTHDGGGLLPLSDLTAKTKVVPVKIVEDEWTYLDTAIKLSDMKYFELHNNRDQDE